jgi:hypothetical protein
VNPDKRCGKTVTISLTKSHLKRSPVTTSVYNARLTLATRLPSERVGQKILRERARGKWTFGLQIQFTEKPSQMPCCPEGSFADVS